MNTYEKNEYEVAKSFCDLFRIKNPVIHPTINPFSPVDLEYTHMGIEWEIEIKCRKSSQNSSYIIEKNKLKHMIFQITDFGKECRYINYFEDSDTLIVFDINSRKNLELEDVFFCPYVNKFYDELQLPISNSGYQTKKKYIKYLYLNQYQTKDYVIWNYSELMKENKIEFNYEK